MKSLAGQKTTFFLIFLFFFTLSIQPLSASAEIINPENSVSLSIQPNNPGANSQVDATIESYLIDLNKAKISWFINGALKQTGTGKTGFSFTTGALGKTTNIGVNVDTLDGTHVEKELSLKTANVDLAWEAFSYTPPFYKGKSLFSPQGTVRIVALPDLVDANGTPIGSDKLIYKWTQDRQVMGDSSGYGKDSYVFAGDIFTRPVDIKLEVSSPSGSQTAEKTITLSPTTPQVTLYEDNPLFGTTYEKSLPTNFSLTDPEIKILAVPYFFNTGDPLTFSWSMNGNPFIDGQSLDGKSITLRQNGQSGQALISLGVKNDTSFLQTSGINSSVFFSNTVSTNSATH